MFYCRQFHGFVPILLNILALSSFVGASDDNIGNKKDHPSGKVSPSASHCGHFEVNAMKRVDYKPFFGDKTKTAPLKSVRIADEHFDAGQYGQLAIGFMEHTVNCCVAVKIVSEAKGKDFDELLNGANVLREVQMLPEEKRRHIIRMFDAGTFTTFEWLFLQRRKALLIMEKGTENLSKRMYAVAAGTIHRDDQCLEPFVRKVVQPLVELHQVAIHLDVKPANFVFVENSDGKELELLKLVDFDGAQLLLDMGHQHNHLRANLRVAAKHHFQTRLYASHEIFADKEYSTKADIWSIGIILFEALLIEKYYEERKRESQTEDDFRESIRHRLRALWSLYHGLTIEDEDDAEVSPLFAIPENSDRPIPLWFDAYYDAFVDILELWNHYPRTALLITNMLCLTATRRMSASGIMDYLDRKCFPAELAVQDTAKLILFNTVTVADFGTLIDAKVRETLKADSPPLIAKHILNDMAKLKHLLEGAMEQRRELWGPRGNGSDEGSHCDAQKTAEEEKMY